MNQAQDSWVVRARVLPRYGLTRAVAQVRTTYRRLKKRYGPSYTRAMVGGAFVALFLPLPGSTLLAVGLIVAIAELHRAISQRGGFDRIRGRRMNTQGVGDGIESRRKTNTQGVGDGIESH
jgi:hypothetical protein